MNNIMNSTMNSGMDDLSTQWQRPLQAAICEKCDWIYLAEDVDTAVECPHCYQTKLTPLGGADIPTTHPPELVAQFVLPPEKVRQQLDKFATSITLAPMDLKTENLVSRLRQIYVPIWLVDSSVAANWQAEMGYNYEVVSHKERYTGGRWQTFKETETKIRWEQRLGKLKRRYNNITAPALEEHGVLAKKMGSFDLKGDAIQKYQPHHIENILVRLPNRNTADAWGDAQPRFQENAKQECQKAGRGDHIRQFKWSPEFSDHDWTQLLLPLYSTCYYDDDDVARPILLNGRTGQIDGVKRASMRRAKKITRNLAILAGLFFIIALALLFYRPGFALLLGMITIAIGIGAIAPVAIVSQFNRRQQSDVPFSISAGQQVG